jgi:hypothetical protein
MVTEELPNLVTEIMESIRTVAGNMSQAVFKVTYPVRHCVVKECVVTRLDVFCQGLIGKGEIAAGVVEIYQAQPQKIIRLVTLHHKVLVEKIQSCCCMHELNHTSTAKLDQRPK